MKQVLTGYAGWIMAAAAVCVLIAGNPAAADNSREVKIIQNSIEVLEDLRAIPENRIPPALLGEAEAIAVIPSVYKLGFIIGGRYGSGVVAVRDDAGNWNNPFFIKLYGGSIGWQIGAQSTDLVLVFKSRKAIDQIKNGRFTVGADASVAAGPVGRQAGAATDVTLKSEIYSYSRSRGAFAGLSLEGAALQTDHTATWNLYEETVDRIDVLREVPESVLLYKDMLNKYVGE
ncbi:MAG: lipid-binding SYLF domain-containing protein [Desulfobacterales bacterium]|nr:lipid-binding SYLF domain-containing protein [Desulfobacterales bacterium]